MQTMIVTRINPNSWHYWNILKNLDEDSKKDLIIMLVESMKPADRTAPVLASDYYGIWGDDGMSAEEFVGELEASRTINREIAEL